MRLTQTQLRVLVLQASNKYLFWQPNHPFGFCWYASHYIAQQLRTTSAHVPGVYELIGEIMKLLGYGNNGYVDDEHGCTPLRLQFVADLRTFLIHDQD